MSIHLGRVNIEDIQIGGYQIAEGYVGNVLVYTREGPDRIFIGEKTGWMPSKYVEYANISERNMHTIVRRPSDDIPGYTDNNYGITGHSTGIAPCTAAVNLNGLDVKGYKKLIIEGEITHNTWGRGSRYVRVRDYQHENQEDPYVYVLGMNHTDGWIYPDDEAINDFRIEYDVSNIDRIDVSLSVNFNILTDVDIVNLWMWITIKSLKAIK